LAEKELFGEDHFYWELYEMAERIQKSSMTDSIPLLNKNASSLTFYQKGAWALFDLNQQIGDKAFDKAIQNYLKKYAFKTVETQDFLNEVKKVTFFNDKVFYNKWLLNTEFPVEDAIALLQKNQGIESYLKLVELQEHSFESKQKLFEKILKSDHYYALKEEVIYQLAKEKFESIAPLISIAKSKGDRKINQAIVRILNPIPEEYRTVYESFLQEKSYITIEIALGALWSQFPEHRHNYLRATKNIEGFKDKNLRILWLTLALMTKDFDNEEKVTYYDELLNYASTDYNSFIRQNAITNLLFLNPNDLNIMKHLIQATTHHRWQFTMFARNQISALMKSEQHKNYFKTILPELNEKEQIQLKKLFP
jgi:aminopeptidase N